MDLMDDSFEFQEIPQTELQVKQNSATRGKFKFHPIRIPELENVPRVVTSECKGKFKFRMIRIPELEYDSKNKVPSTSKSCQKRFQPLNINVEEELKQLALKNKRHASADAKRSYGKQNSSIKKSAKRRKVEASNYQLESKAKKKLLFLEPPILTPIQSQKTKRLLKGAQTFSPRTNILTRSAKKQLSDLKHFEDMEKLCEKDEVMSPLSTITKRFKNTSISTKKNNDLKLIHTAVTNLEMKHNKFMEKQNELLNKIMKDNAEFTKKFKKEMNELQDMLHANKENITSTNCENTNSAPKFRRSLRVNTLCKNLVTNTNINDPAMEKAIKHYNDCRKEFTSLHTPKIGRNELMEPPTPKTGNVQSLSIKLQKQFLNLFDTPNKVQ